MRRMDRGRGGRWSGAQRAACWRSKALLVEQRDALRVRRLRDRLQIGVDVGEIVLRQDFLLVGRHRSVAAAYEGRERLERDRPGRQRLAGNAALPLRAVALPAAVLDKRGLALLGRSGECAAATECQAGGERRRPENTYQTHREVSLPRLRPDVEQRGLPGFHYRDRFLDRGAELRRVLDRTLGPPAHRLRDLVVLDVRVLDAGAD